MARKAQQQNKAAHDEERGIITRPKRQRKASSLEVAFIGEWERQAAENANPEQLRLTPEHRFHPVREWRADFAHEASMTLIELEGGVWSGGRHTRGKGFVEDCNKYLSAWLRGWNVIRLTKEQVTPPIIAAIQGRVKAAARERSEAAAAAGVLSGKAAASFADVGQRGGGELPAPAWLEPSVA